MSVVLGLLWILVASFIASSAYARWGYNYSWRESAEAGAAVALLVIIGMVASGALLGLIFASELIFGSLGFLYLIGAVVLFALFMSFKESGVSILRALRNMTLFLAGVALIFAPLLILA